MNIQEIGDVIMKRFAETKSKPNHIIDQRWLNHGLYNTLNPKEKELFNSAINELVDKKLITVEKRQIGQCLVLTDLGYDYIYPIDEAFTIEKIKNLF